VEVVKYLLKDSRLITPFEYDILLEAVKNNHTEIVEVLLSDPSLGSRAQKPIRFAIENNNTDIAKLLLADPAAGMEPQRG
jgi:hypothetical protein